MWTRGKLNHGKQEGGVDPARTDSRVPEGNNCAQQLDPSGGATPATDTLRGHGRESGASWLSSHRKDSRAGDLVNSADAVDETGGRKYQKRPLPAIFRGKNIQPPHKHK